MRGVSYKNYLLAVLLTILAFNYVDRAALGLVLQDLKLDLALSDTQLGTLTGIAFALFYSLMGLPIARWADRGNRVTIISTTTALWSVAVSACGLAGSFLQLLCIRAITAVGEAGCIPPAHSLIADHFSRAERPRAVARYMLGGPLSMVVGYFLAGWLNEFYGWRITFMMLGVPGLVLAGIAWLTLGDPRTPNIRSVGVRPRCAVVYARQPSVGAVCATLWANRTFRQLLLGFSVIYFFSSGIANWQPVFFVRSYGLQTGELGTWLMVIYGLGGLAGTYLGGELASRYLACNERLQLRAIAAIECGFGIISAVIYLSSNKYQAFALMALAAVGVNMVTGPLLATIQTLVPQQMRASSIAIIYFFANLIGMGLGPLLAGALSDAIRPVFAEESLRYALLALCPGYFWGAWHLWRGSVTVARDLSAMHENTETELEPENSRLSTTSSASS